MSIENLLYQDSIEVTNKIAIAIPTVGQVIDNESDYYMLVSMLTAMPIDFMVLLDDMGLDFSVMTEYELFLNLFPYIKTVRASALIFKDLDLTKFCLAKNTNDGSIVYVDVENDIVIDKKIHSMISSAIRKLHNLKKDIRKPANIEAKEYMLDVAKRRARRRALRPEKSQIESIIVAMVNSPEFKYDFRSVRDISIYQFNESVRQVIKRVDYGNRMYGIYTGTIKSSDISKEDLNWLTH